MLSDVTEISDAAVAFGGNSSREVSHGRSRQGACRRSHFRRFDFRRDFAPELFRFLLLEPLVFDLLLFGLLFAGGFAAVLRELLVDRDFDFDFRLPPDLLREPEF